MKKIVSFFLAIALVISLLPANQMMTAKAATTITTVAQLKNALASGGTYEVRANLTVSDQLVVSKNVTLYCSGTARTITSTCSKDSIVVKKGVSFRLGYSNNDSKKITIKRTKNTSEYAVVKVQKGGIFTLGTGILYSGFYGVYNKGTTNLYVGGVINNTKHSGVYNYLNASFFMNGGTIRVSSKQNQNTAPYVTKAGIENRGKAILKMGTIENYERGVYNSGEFIMTGGLIQKNYSSGIFNIGTVRMTNGIIRNNAEDGVINYKEFLAVGGEISNNEENGIDVGIYTDVPAKYAADQGIGLDFSDETMVEYIENAYEYMNALADELLDETLPSLNPECGIDWSVTIIEEQSAKTYIKDAEICGNNKNGIMISNGYVYIDESTIKNNSNAGVYLFSGHVLIEDSVINYNNTGIYALANVSGSSTKLYNTEVARNSSNGIYSNTKLAILNGSFHDNGLSGLRLNNGRAYIYGGAYYNNGNYGIYATKTSIIKAFSRYTMVNNKSGNINFKLSALNL